MKAILICPAERPAEAAFAEKVPLPLLPVLGRNILHYWLAHLGSQGVKEVTIVADDRPEEIRQYVQNGGRWGMRVNVVPVPCEMSPEEVRFRFRQGDPKEWLAEPHDVILMDHLPTLSKRPLGESHAQWFQTLVAWIQYAHTPDRIGMREIQPGIWAGLRAHISPLAELTAPCWIGEDAQIGPHAVVGPMAIVEDRAVIETGALVSHSWVGPDTYVGEFTSLINSLAWGSTLVNWETGSQTKVPDKFLLCSLRNPAPKAVRVSAFSRALALLTLVLTAPFCLLAISKALLRNQRAFRLRSGVRPAACGGNTFRYYELTQASPWFARWPQLWNVFKGEMAWVGNRPLTESQAGDLTTEYEKQWLGCAPGLISLGDTKGLMNQFDDEARAHAAWYTAARSGWLNTSILADAFTAWLLGEQTTKLSDRMNVSIRSLLAAAERIHIWTFKT